MAKTKQRPRPRIDAEKIPTHVNLISSQVSDWLHEHCGTTTRGPRSSYITDATWQLRGSRLQLQRRMRPLRGQVRKALRFDRTQYLEQLGHEVMSADPRSYTYKILRNAGVRGKAKKNAIQPLPFLKLKNAAGEVVSTFGE